MNEPVFENSMFTDDKSYEISIRAWVCIPDATLWLQTGALADSTELQYTENKFILNKFPRRMFLYTKWEIAMLINEFRWKMVNHLYIPITKSHW